MVTKIGWPTLRVHQLRQDLDNAHHTFTSYPGADDVNAALARFYVVRCCGLIETVAVSCAHSYVENRSDTRSYSYASSWLSWGITSAKPAHLVDFVGKFDSQWRVELDAFFREDDEYLWRELSGLVDKRNRIAHGESEGVNTTKALQYGEVARGVCDWLQNRFDPN